MEAVTIQVPDAYAGAVIEMMGKRLAQMQDMRVDRGETFLHFNIPTRGLIGIRNRFLTATKGTGIINSIFLGYEPFKGELTANPHGSLCASEQGESNFYGLVGAQARGTLFIPDGVSVYEGMVVGQHSKDEDIFVNVCKSKHLTNFRASQTRAVDALNVPRDMSLEHALDYIGDDELVEITPKNVRIRKIYLDANERKRYSKSGG